MFFCFHTANLDMSFKFHTVVLPTSEFQSYSWPINRSSSLSSFKDEGPLKNQVDQLACLIADFEENDILSGKITKSVIQACDMTIDMAGSLDKNSFQKHSASLADILRISSDVNQMCTSLAQISECLASIQAEASKKLIQ